MQRVQTAEARRHEQLETPLEWQAIAARFETSPLLVLRQYDNRIASS